MPPMPSLFRQVATFGCVARSSTDTYFVKSKATSTSPSAMNLASSVLVRPMSTHQSFGHNVNESPSSLIQHASVFARIAAAAYVFQLYVGNCTMSIGPSMLPTMNERGDIVMTEAITPRLKLLNKGDIVVATKPTDPRVAILKRIQGMPGDTVCVGHSNGDSEDKDNYAEVIVPSDHIWLQGDNQEQSTDSRHYGAVPMTLIRAKVWCRIWPLQEIAWFHNDEGEKVDVKG